MRDEIIENKYIKDNHKSYMMAMKIYALRCRSKTLTERVKVFWFIHIYLIFSKTQNYKSGAWNFVYKLAPLMASKQK